MMKKQLLAVGILVSSWIPLQSSPAQAALFVFGDSLSDTGNVYIATGGTFPPSPPYYQGRFSDGPNWVDYVQGEFGLEVRNYAFGGADTDGSAFGALSIVEQVAFYSTFVTPSQPPTDNDIYAIWGGANDYLFSGQTDPTIPVQNLLGLVGLLEFVGAKNFLLFNLPSLGDTPYATTTGQSASLNALSDAHNTLLAAGVNNLEQIYMQLQEEVKISLVDIDSLFDNISANPAQYGLTDVTTGCILNSTNPFPVCTNPQEHLFWDDVHPTTGIHAAIGSEVSKTLRAEFIPEPTSVMAILSMSLLGIGWVKRK